VNYTTLGRTGLKVSVAGLGCGGSSRLGLTAGHSEAHCVGVIHRALEHGVNLIDTARYYGTEGIVGAALKAIPRESVVISTKHKIQQGDALTPASDVVAGLDASLKALQTDYVDVFFLHTVLPGAYDHAVNEIMPAVLREKQKGKFRFLGITEMPPKDPHQAMLQMALNDDFFDVVMLAFHMLNQSPRRTVFPATLEKNVGTLIMFAVRSLFSTPGRLEKDVKALVASGKLPAWLADRPQPLDFLLQNDGAKDIIEAAYRYSRHEPGADVVLFGTGNPAHVENNINAILQPPLPHDATQKLAEWFGHLEGVGLDEPTLKH
jgi:aryl-alcohol dehydrogenase-like predicted oxidoreductase